MPKRKSMDTIRKDASLALSGAEYVKDKILALTTIGPRNLYDQVYAIKIRVKSIDSLSQKIAEKKTAKSASYSAADVTDIVGMRLLCLYAEDLPRATKALISFFRLCQSPEIKLLEGENLNEAVHEIRIYKSNNTSRIYDTVYRECSKLQLSDANGNGERKVQLIESDDSDKTYSSIHFVVFCLSHASGTPTPIPLEVQVRTVFEDTWGEIDHSLQYKGAHRKGRKIPKNIAPFYEQNKTLLARLKDQLENAGQLAEAIRGGYQAISDQLAHPSHSKGQTFTFAPTYWGAPAVNVAQIEHSLSADLRSQFDVITTNINSIQCRVRKGFPNVAEAKSFIKQVETITEKLESFRDDLNENPLPNDAVNIDALYFLGMEIGNLNVWRAKVSRHFSINALDTDIDLLKIAQKEYFSLERINHLKSDPVLNFRLGLIMHDLGLPEQSDFFLYRAYDNLSDDKQIFSTVTPAVIANFLAFSVWLKRAKLHSMAISSGNPQFNREDQRSLVAEAFYFSLIGKRLLSHSSADAVTLGEAALNINNNLICYLWEIRDLSQSRDDCLSLLEEMISEADEEQMEAFPEIPINKQSIEKIGSVVIEAQNAEPDTRKFADTLMKYYHLIGDKENLELHRSKLSDIIQVEGSSTKQEEQNDLYTYSINRTKGKEENYALALRLEL